MAEYSRREVNISQATIEGFTLIVQGKMAGNSKICIGIQSQLILPEFINLPGSF